jgi:hypothetical protein
MENKPKSLHVNPVGENWEVAELAKELASTAKDDRGQPRDAAFLGRWLTLNPIAILLTFLLWSYLCGVVGTLLAVPFLATFKIFCARIEPLRQAAFLGRP